MSHSYIVAILILSVGCGSVQSPCRTIGFALPLVGDGGTLTIGGEAFYINETVTISSMNISVVFNTQTDVAISVSPAFVLMNSTVNCTTFNAQGSGNSSALELRGKSALNLISSSFSGFTSSVVSLLGAGDSLSAVNCSFVRNSAPQRGGAIFVSAIASSLTLTACELRGNSLVSGGASASNAIAGASIWTAAPSFTMTACTVADHVCAGALSVKGCAIYALNTAEATIDSCTFSNISVALPSVPMQQANITGAVLLLDVPAVAARLTVRNSRFSSVYVTAAADTVASVSGGVILSQGFLDYSGAVQICGCEFSDISLKVLPGRTNLTLSSTLSGGTVAITTYSATAGQPINPVTVDIDTCLFTDISASGFASNVYGLVVFVWTGNDDIPATTTTAVRNSIFRGVTYNLTAAQQAALTLLTSPSSPSFSSKTTSAAAAASVQQLQSTRFYGGVIFATLVSNAAAPAPLQGCPVLLVNVSVVDTQMQVPGSVHGSVFYSYTSCGSGGALLNISSLLVTNTTVTATAASVGGVLRLDIDQPLLMQDTWIVGSRLLLQQLPGTAVATTLTGGAIGVLTASPKSNMAALTHTLTRVTLLDMQARVGNARLQGAGIYLEATSGLVLSSLAGSGGPLSNWNGYSGPAFGGGATGTVTAVLSDVRIDGVTALANTIVGIGMYLAMPSVITNSAFTGNAQLPAVTSEFAISVSQGGGLFTAADCAISNSLFEGNSAGLGGGVYVSSGAVITLTDTLFVSNLAVLENGGGLAVEDGVPLIDSCVFTGNSAELRGGGMDFGIASQGATVRNCSFTQNMAVYGAGASAGIVAPVTFLDCIFANNTALSEGASVSSESPYLQMHRCIVSGGLSYAIQSDVAYGSVSLTGAFSVIANCSFYSNRIQLMAGGANSLGGAAIGAGSNAQVDILNCSFANNQAYFGGAVLASESSIVHVYSSLMVGNIAEYGGGGLGAIDSSFMTVQDSVLIGNSAPVGGGLHCGMSSRAVVSRCLFVNNSANFGGGIYSDGTRAVTVNSSQITGNAAALSGGGLLWTQAQSVIDTVTTITNNVAPIGPNLSSEPRALAISVVGSLLSASERALCAPLAGTFPAESSFQNGTAVLASGCSIPVAVTLLDAYGAPAVAVESKISLGLGTCPVSGGGSAPLLSVSVSSNTSGKDKRVLSSTRTARIRTTSSSSSSSSGSSMAVGASGGSGGGGDGDGSGACLGGVTQTVIAGSAAVFNVSLSGNVGDSFCISFATDVLSTNALTSNSLNGTIGACPRGLVVSTVRCDVCSICTNGLFNIEGGPECFPCVASTSMCNGCESSAVGCQGALVWNQPGYWVRYDRNSTGVQAVACTPSSACVSACTGNATGSAAVATSPTGTPLTNTTAACYSQLAATRAAFTCYDSGEELGAAVETEALVSGYCEAVNGCAEGRTGFMCGVCREGYGDWSDACVPCDAPQYGIVAAFILGNFAYIFVVHILLSGEQSAESKILIYYAQIASLIVGEGTVNVWISIGFSIISLRFDTTGGVCPYPRTFFGRIGQQLAVPGISLLQLGFCILAVWLVTRIRGISFDWTRYFSRPLISLLLSVYAPLALGVFEILPCMTVDNFRVVAAAPALSCDSAAYHFYVVIAYVVLAVVVVGMPTATSGLLLRQRRWLSAKEVHSRFGFLYESYRPTRFWWEVVVMLRRGVLAALSLMTQDQQRSYAVAVCCFAFAVTHMAFAPYTDSMENHLETIALLGLLLLALTRSSGLFLVQSESAAIVLGVTAALPFVIVIAVILYRMRKTIVDVLLVVRWVLWHRMRASQRPKLSTALPFVKSDSDLKQLLLTAEEDAKSMKENERL